jgi:aminoglycoside 6'-N-acetyltransferase
LRAIRRAPAVAAWWGPLEPDFPDEEPESTRFAVVAEDRVVGMVQYGEENEPAYRHAWIDLFLDPAVHGRGLGTDAVRTMARHLFDDRGHHRITIDPTAENPAAIRAYEKAGFRRVGILQASERAPDGRWRDALLMERVELPR